MGKGEALEGLDPEIGKGGEGDERSTTGVLGGWDGGGGVIPNPFFLLKPKDSVSEESYVVVFFFLLFFSKLKKL